jgi:V/A-type H+-transporting ATPase subunit E
MAKARASLQQAARDVVLSVRDAVTKTLDDIVTTSVAETLNGDALNDLIAEVVKAYCGGETGGPAELLVSEEQKSRVQAFFMSKLKEAAAGGMDIKSDTDLVAGFRVSLSGGSVQHDFSAEAIADTFSQLLRPHIAEIAKAAVAKDADRHEEP